ncbi:MAG: methyl-accepting chemotaxis protein [Paracoccaceae bacterium]
MTTQEEFPDLRYMNKLAQDASSLGFDIVDLAGFIHLVEQQAQTQRSALNLLEQSAKRVGVSNAQVQAATTELSTSAEQTFCDVKTSADLMREMGENSRSVAEWVKNLNGKTASVSDTLHAVKANNSQIASISLQVNTLAINAKIEAARAGDAGRGFAVVAEAINTLSQQTKTAAEEISSNIESLANWISVLGKETGEVSKNAEGVLKRSSDTDAALGRMEDSVQLTQSHAVQIQNCANDVAQVLSDFHPSLDGLGSTIDTTSSNINDAEDRIELLVDRSEAIVQSSALMGGTTVDGPFIKYVCDLSKQLGQRLDNALSTGKISESNLFDRTYRIIVDTNPEQKMARFTALFDEVLPDLQEDALKFSDKIVFCAAVDQNGYLPTHNRKFSKPQSSDPVWNTANCRNRRIFDDRVGLKAGRNTDPFLLQVYRRDMGGDQFVIMKDLSAPIFAAKRHWGGLRLAYNF